MILIVKILALIVKFYYNGIAVKKGKNNKKVLKFLTQNILHLR